jgi:hypothetical protein
MNDCVETISLLKLLKSLPPLLVYLPSDPDNNWRIHTQRHSIYIGRWCASFFLQLQCCTFAIRKCFMLKSMRDNEKHSTKSESSRYEWLELDGSNRLCVGQEMQFLISCWWCSACLLKRLSSSYFLMPHIN